MKVCIIIPTYNRKDYLEKLLYQIKTQKIRNHIVETIVIVDGSTDGTLEMLEDEFPEVHIVEGTGNWWYTKSMNKGFKYAEKLKPDYVLTLNDDIEIGEDYIKKLLESFSKVDRRSIMGSIAFTIKQPHRVFYSGIKKTIWWRNKSFRYHKLLLRGNPKDFNGVYSSKALPGRGMLIPFSILNELDGFDNKFLQYGSDFDFCFRAAKKGINIYISYDAQIFCHHEATSKNSSFIKNSFSSFINGFFAPHSRSYLKDSAIILIRNENILLVPFSLFITILASFKNFILSKMEKVN